MLVVNGFYEGLGFRIVLDGFMKGHIKVQDMLFFCDVFLYVF